MSRFLDVTQPGPYPDKNKGGLQGVSSVIGGSGGMPSGISKQIRHFWDLQRGVTDTRKNPGYGPGYILREEGCFWFDRSHIHIFFT